MKIKNLGGPRPRGPPGVPPTWFLSILDQFWLKNLWKINAMWAWIFHRFFNQNRSKIDKRVPLGYPSVLDLHKIDFFTKFIDFGPLLGPFLGGQVGSKFGALGRPGASWTLPGRSLKALHPLFSCFFWAFNSSIQNRSKIDRFWTRFGVQNPSKINENFILELKSQKPNFLVVFFIVFEDRPKRPIFKNYGKTQCFWAFF